MKTTIVNKLLNESDSNKTIRLHDHITPIIASSFSVFFALSIILELKDVVEPFMLYVLSAFLIFFLIVNETAKVTQLRKWHANRNFNVLILISTFCITLFTSGVGIYFWTNKSSKMNSELKINYAMEEQKILTKYYNIEREINFQNTEIKNDYRFISINDKLNYWKTRKASSLEERQIIRNNIISLENDLKTSLNSFEAQKKKQIEKMHRLRDNELNQLKINSETKTNKITRNNFVSYIFFALIVIIEFSIIGLNMKIGEKIKNMDDILNKPEAQRLKQYFYILDLLYLTKSKGNKLDINDIKYNPFGWSLDFEHVKEMFNLLINLKIIDKDSGEILMDKNEGKRTFKYFIEKAFV